ncbi:replication/maintenance protein RepL [Metaclostridioides mangenotii]|uniref:replication/maintenance protein RepL n=1 Tax=Metaclostridioides mangenotii TaxID=1540 RepID=UPI0031CF9740
MKNITVGENRNILNPNSVSFNEREKQLNFESKLEEDVRKREKKSPYKNFLQVNKDYYKAEDWLMAKSPIAYRIFKFLTNNMDEYNAVICSQTVLSENFDVSRATVARAIKLLKEKGYIAVLKSGTSNVYALNDKLVWNSWGTNYPYSKFPANVILSLSEQEENLQSKIKNIKHKEITMKD